MTNLALTGRPDRCPLTRRIFIFDGVGEGPDHERQAEQLWGLLRDSLHPGTLDEFVRRVVLECVEPMEVAHG